MTSAALKPSRPQQQPTQRPTASPGGRWRVLPQVLIPATLTSLAIVLWGLWAVTARPVVVTVDGLTATLYTHRHTVGALLTDLGLTLQPADRITPAFDAPLSRQSSVQIERARPLRILADGRDLLAASWGATPRQVLADVGIPLDAYDQVVVDGVGAGLDDPLPPPLVTIAPTTFDRGYAWASRTVTPVQLRVRRAIPMTVDEGQPALYHSHHGTDRG